MLTYARPGAATTAILLHAGSLRSNLVQVVTPPQFADLQDTVLVPVAPPVSELAPSYVPPDAAVVAAAGYDELYIDPQPQITGAGNVGSVSAATLEALRQVTATDRPYWVTIRCDGYGRAATSSQAIAIALAVSQWASDLAASLLASPRLRGFAFVSADLNVRFSDGSVITRLQQNQLAQQAWALGTACTLVTSRPADATTLVGPQFSPDVAHRNPNAGAALPYPIIGTNPAQRDRIVALYPVTQTTRLAPSVLLGMLGGLIGTRGRDPGFPLNLDIALALQPNEQAITPDGLGGTQLVDAGWLARVLGFAAALGVTTLGVTSTAYVLPVDRLMPEDSAVNTTGAVRVAASDGIVRVSYADATGATSGITRGFDSAFREVALVTG